MHGTAAVDAEPEHEVKRPGNEQSMGEHGERVGLDEAKEPTLDKLEACSSAEPCLHVGTKDSWRPHDVTDPQNHTMGQSTARNRKGDDDQWLEALSAGGRWLNSEHRNPTQSSSVPPCRHSMRHIKVRQLVAGPSVVPIPTPTRINGVPEPPSDIPVMPCKLAPAPEALQQGHDEMEHVAKGPVFQTQGELKLAHDLDMHLQST